MRTPLNRDSHAPAVSCISSRSVRIEGMRGAHEGANPPRSMLQGSGHLAAKRTGRWEVHSYHVRTIDRVATTAGAGTMEPFREVSGGCSDLVSSHCAVGRIGVPLPGRTRLLCRKERYSGS